MTKKVGLGATTETYKAKDWKKENQNILYTCTCIKNGGEMIRRERENIMYCIKNGGEMIRRERENIMYCIKSGGEMIRRERENIMYCIKNGGEMIRRERENIMYCIKNGGEMIRRERENIMYCVKSGGERKHKNSQRMHNQIMIELHHFSLPLPFSHTSIIKTLYYYILVHLLSSTLFSDHCCY